MKFQIGETWNAWQEKDCLRSYRFDLFLNSLLYALQHNFEKQSFLTKCHKVEMIHVGLDHVNDDLSRKTLNSTNYLSDKTGG